MVRLVKVVYLHQSMNIIPEYTKQFEIGQNFHQNLTVGKSLSNLSRACLIYNNNKVLKKTAFKIFYGILYKTAIRVELQKGFA